ncbi:MAG: T9SS type A sorting domain-containing protein [Bacteroidetes bacterium]|nr:T9SS type A sorting domain-containing protein [Bacteroidota bacterium]
MNKLLILIFFLINCAYGFCQWEPVFHREGSPSFKELFFFNQDTGFIITYNSLINTYDGGNNWEEQFMDNVYFQFADVVSDSSAVICCNYEFDSLFVTTNRGVTWIKYPTNLESFIPISDIDYINLHKSLAIFQSGSLIYSIQGDFPYGYIYSYSLMEATGIVNVITMINEDTGYVCGELIGWDNIGTVYKTTDGGYSWFSNNDMFGPTYFMQFTDVNTGFGWGYDGFCSTTNGGLNWSFYDINIGIEYKYRSEGQLFFLDNLSGYTLVHDVKIDSSHITSLVKTNDGGLNWYRTDFILSDFDFGYQDLYCFNDDTCFILTTNTIYKSENASAPDLTINILNETRELFHLSPNPATTILHLQLALKENNYTIQTFNLVGELMPVNFQNNQADISHLPPGIYFTEVITEQGRAVQKWVKM